MSTTKLQWELFDEILTYKATESIDKYIQSFDINQADATGSTLLHVMVSLGNPELVAYVLNKGATVDVIDGNGFTPLALASSSYFTESVKVLLNAGADVNLGKGIFPLIQAIYRYATTRSTTVIETLLEHGADPNIRARTGLTATDYAKHWGYEKVVKLIDIHEADLERQRLGAMIQVVARTTNQKMKL